MTNERHRHLEGGSDHGSHLGGTQVVGAQYALHDEEVGGPVAEADHEAQPEDDPCPMHAHRVIAEVAQGRPHMREVGRADVDCDLRLQVGPAAGLDQAENRDQRSSGPDEKQTAAPR